MMNSQALLNIVTNNKNTVGNANDVYLMATSQGRVLSFNDKMQLKQFTNGQSINPAEIYK